MHDTTTTPIRKRLEERAKLPVIEHIDDFGEVRIRRLSPAEFAEVLQFPEDDQRPELLQRCLVDEEGKRVFDSIDEIRKEHDRPLIEALVLAAMKVNNLTNKVKAAEGN